MNQVHATPTSRHRHHHSKGKHNSKRAPSRSKSPGKNPDRRGGSAVSSDKRITTGQLEDACCECKVNESLWYCKECVDQYCSGCWMLIHSRGKRAAHVRENYVTGEAHQDHIFRNYFLFPSYLHYTCVIYNREGCDNDIIKSVMLCAPPAFISYQVYNE
jgi:hypothetical protein